MRPLALVWVSWGLGPANLAFCFALNDGEPNCSLALLAVVGHSLALWLTLVMTGSWTRFRQLPESWFMLTYWTPLAATFMDFAIDAVDLGRVTILVVLGWVALVPLAGGTRLVHAGWRALRNRARAR